MPPFYIFQEIISRKAIIFYSVLVLLFLPFNAAISQENPSSDSSITDTISVITDISNSNNSANEEESVKIIDFGPDYNSYLDKADRAFNIGFLKRAKKYYLKAAEINPKSLYIKYRIKEIEQFKGKINTIVFFLNFDKPGLLIQSITYLVIYFIISMFIILLIILGNRRRMEKIDRKKQTLKELYQQLLVDYLFSEDNNDSIVNSFHKVIISNFNRKILIDQMIDLSINLTGEAKDKLRNLYLSLSLDKDSITKAYSNLWHIKVKGFRELTFMDITDANEEIIRCLQSNNDILRMEAQLALVRLNHEDSFSFLDYLEKPFTLWEQLTVYETIMFHNLPVPQFDKWLFSKNKSVVIFAIRMIDIFKQKETYPNLFWMLVNEDSDIRFNTIRVIGNLRVKDALPHLKRLYKTENYNNCIAIIQAIAKMPDESIVNFLKLIIDKEDEVQLQIEAAMALNNAGEIGKNTLEKLLKSDYKNYQIIIKHVLDKRIS